MRAHLGLYCAAALVLSGCRGGQTRISFQPWVFEDESGDSVRGELGYLRVPEWHGRTSGDSIRLAVARFAAATDAVGPPIIYLEGGPGGAGIHPERMGLLVRLREFGDVISFDQRGTGQSEPDLGCGPSAQLSASPTRSTWFSAEEAAARRCAREISARAVDLAAYNVFESVEDIESIRVALGADRVRLVGISFGSHLGLAMLKRHGDRVERAVFAGVEGLHQTVKLPSALDEHLGQVSRLIASDSVAGDVLPDFEGLVRTTLAELDREPLRVAVDGDTVTLTGFKFRRLVAGSIVRRQFLRFAPEEFAPIQQGDYRPIARVAATNRVAPFGTRAAMDCGSGVPPARWRQVEEERASTLLQGVVDFPFPEICDAWGLGSLGPDLWSRFQYEGPVLFLSGGLDGLTPISNVEELRTDFPNSGHLVVGLMGHEGPGLWFGSPDVMPYIGEFLAGGAPRDLTVSAPPIDWTIGPEGS